MDAGIAWLADYLLVVMAVLALATWTLREDPPGRREFAAVAVLGIALATVPLVLERAVRWRASRLVAR